MFNVDEDIGMLFILSILYRKGGVFMCKVSNVLGLDSVLFFVIVFGENVFYKFIIIIVDGVFCYYYCWCKLMFFLRKILVIVVVYKCFCLMDLVYVVYGSFVMLFEGKCM